PPPGVKRYISGYGNGIHTGLMNEVIEEVDALFVADADAVAACHDLRKRDIWVGGSSGGTAAALIDLGRRKAHRLARHAPVALISPDGGEKYEATIWNPDWLGRHGLAGVVRADEPKPEPAPLLYQNVR